MSTLASIYLKKETLETLLKVVEKKGEKGVELTVNFSDETNQWGQNVSGWVSQTKEQREVKKDRFYVGNGKVFWTDGTVKVATKEDQPSQPPVNESDDDDLPF